MKEIIEPPIYWHSSNEAVLEDIKKIKRGKVKKLRPSAGNRDIYLVEYEVGNFPTRTAGLSSALGARRPDAYADRSSPDYVPTVFIAGCIHGGEFEGTVAIMNLISLLETGKDLAGNPNDTLLSAADKVHLLLIPICNPDGRSHVPFNNFVGHSFYDLRYYNQGTWKNGELCGYPDCKVVHPIKDAVDFLGGYFNDDGVNLMHDDFFGRNSNETQNILDVCMDMAPDVAVLCHGGDNTTPTFTSLNYASANAKKEMAEIAWEIGRLYSAFDIPGFGGNHEKYQSFDQECAEIPGSFNLISAMHHCCGAPCITFESNQGLNKENSLSLDNDTIYLSHTLMFEAVCSWAWKKRGPTKD